MTTKCSVLIIHERLGHSDISTGRHGHNRCNIGNFTGQFILVFEFMLYVCGKQLRLCLVGQLTHPEAVYYYKVHILSQLIEVRHEKTGFFFCLCQNKAVVRSAVFSLFRSIAALPTTAHLDFMEEE